VNIAQLPFTAPKATFFSQPITCWPLKYAPISIPPSLLLSQRRLCVLCVSALSFCLRFCSPFVFMVLRIAFPATPAFSSSSALLPGVTPSVIPIAFFARREPPPPLQIHVLQQLAASCSLFALFSAISPFVFKRLQPLFAKHRGWVPLSRRSAVSDTQSLKPSRLLLRHVDTRYILGASLTTRFL
jgi:hypothetical protein